jgi:hypothetical protein
MACLVPRFLQRFFFIGKFLAKPPVWRLPSKNMDKATGRVRVRVSVNGDGGVS